MLTQYLQWSYDVFLFSFPNFTYEEIEDQIW